jgi:hypothetical protein
MSVLGTTVFQVPKLGETGFKIDQVNEAKRKQAQQQLQKEVSATGAEKAYMDNAMGLTGIYKQIADASFDVFRQAAIQYEQTGSASDEARMKQAAAQLNYSVNAGSSILKVAGDEYVKNKANGFKDVALSASESSELYTGFVNRTGEVIVKNGTVMVKDGDAFVPATQSTYLQSSVNLNNSFVLPRVIKQGTFVNTSAFIDSVKGAISAGTSEQDAENRVNSLYNNKKNDQAFVSDMLTSYAINKLGMVENPNKISTEDYEKIQALASDEQIMADADAWYQDQIISQVAPLWKATRSGGGLQFGVDIGGGTAKNIVFRKDIKVKVTAQDPKDETKFLAADEPVEGFMALTPNLQGKGYADAADVSKYDINAIAVQDGKLVARKVTSEGSDFMSLSDGRKYKTALEPILLQEWDMLPQETKILVVTRLKEQGYDVNAMIGSLEDIAEKSVTSQEENTGTSSTEDKLREELKSQGFSDAEIESIITGG